MSFPAKLSEIETRPQKQQIYMTSCCGQEITRLPALLEKLEAVLIDVTVYTSRAAD